MGLLKEKNKWVCPSPNRIIDGITCPLTREIYQNPVVTRNGQTYELSAILKWFRKCNKSIDPCTGKELPEDLCINYNAIYLIDLFLEKNPQYEKYCLSDEDRALVDEYNKKIGMGELQSSSEEKLEQDAKPTIVFQFVLDGSNISSEDGKMEPITIELELPMS